MSDWQTIDNAPKDNLFPLDLYTEAGNRWTNCRWLSDIEKWGRKE